MLDQPDEQSICCHRSLFTTRRPIRFPAKVNCRQEKSNQSDYCRFDFTNAAHLNGGSPKGSLCNRQCLAEGQHAPLLLLTFPIRPSRALPTCPQVRFLDLSDLSPGSRPLGDVTFRTLPALRTDNNAKLFIGLSTKASLWMTSGWQRSFATDSFSKVSSREYLGCHPVVQSGVPARLVALRAMTWRARIKGRIQGGKPQLPQPRSVRADKKTPTPRAKHFALPGRNKFGDRSNIVGEKIFNTFLLNVVYFHFLLCDFRALKLKVVVFTTAFLDSFMASSSSRPPEVIVRRPRNFSL